MTGSLFHYTFASPQRDDYVYGPHGIGVRADLVGVVVDAWTGGHPGGASALLRAASEGEDRTVEEVARLAVAAVAARLVGSSSTF
ncbi:hypothetical protein [Embleya sp. NPDC005971]|uniref:hypothetical protein n=1 Tax=Embleya sp. NPDC005971 TaxID=3156724 RepID=UPI003407D664